MKKILLAFALTLIFSVNCFAAWTITPSKVYQTKHYVLWKVVCTSDGDAMTATDLVALMNDDLKRAVQGSTLMIMKVSPGTSGVQPDTTINVTLSDAQGTAIFTKTGYSNSADTTGISLSSDYNQYPTIYDKFYLTLNDIGTSGDQVTLYFECWVE